MKYIVDHSGICEGVYFTAGKPVVLTESIVTALGEHVKPIAGSDKSKSTKPTSKSVTAAPNDKMVKTAEIQK